VDALRCFQHASWEFSPGLNLITGINGCGKTTLLEAVSVLAHGRSFRSARDPQLVRRDARQFRIRGNWWRFGQLHVEARGCRGRVELMLQGLPVQRSDLNEALPVIVEAPQARRLIDGSARERRRWLDGLLIACQSGYGSRYRGYLRCLMQWQRLRRQGRPVAQEMAVWEKQMVTYGLDVTRMRKQILSELNGILSELTDLVEGELVLGVKETAPPDGDSWCSRLAGCRTGERGPGRLCMGPHCDQPEIFYCGREIRHTGSRGQQRLAAIAIRLAEWKLKKTSRGVAPLLLLDDCLESLDRERQRRLLRCLQSVDAQILLTAPTGSSVGFDSATHVHMSGQPDGSMKDGPCVIIAKAVKEAA